MTGRDHTVHGGRPRWLLAPAAIAAVSAALLAAPAAASASSCPSLAHVRAFQGTASTSFSGTASGTDGSGGTQSVSISRTATGLQLNMPYGATGVATVYGAHPGVSPSGGSINVNDQFTDTNPSQSTSGSDSGSGATVSEGSAAILNFFPGSCTYQLAVEWSIDTTQSVTGQPPAADSAGGYGQTGLISIPASLKLSGSISVPVYGSGPDCTRNEIQFMGCYGNNGGFASQYKGLFSSGQQEGTATITWNLAPSGPTSCPVGGGGPTAAADRETVAAAGASGGGVLQPRKVSVTSVTVAACDPGPPEPVKIFTNAEKEEFTSQYLDLAKVHALSCGEGPAYPMWLLLKYYRFWAPKNLVDECDFLELQMKTFAALVGDPPDPRVSTVALPVVPAAKGKTPPRCTYGVRTCRRGGMLAAPYVRAEGQVTAAMIALATSLNRLATAPAAPEDLSATPPQYSRRLQAAAARLYSGLLAAWSDRLQAASSNFAHFLRGLGGKARLAARRMPPVLPAASVWQTFHEMTVYELAQLTEDLISQQIQVPLATYAKHHRSARARISSLTRRLNAAHRRLESDLNAILAANVQSARTAAANRYARDARRIIGIRGLASTAPHAAITAQLLAFAAAALTTSNPRPIAVP